MSLKIPTETNPVWRKIVSGKELYKFEFIATKILLGRLMVMVQHSPEPDVLARGAAELRNIFVRNIRLPSVQRDLQKITGRC